MRNLQPVSRTKPKASEWAIDGLGYGFLAGLVMMAVLMGFGLFQSSSPAEVLDRFAPPLAERGALTAGLAHLAVSAVYGAVFGLLWSQLARRRLSGWLVGLVYGLILLLVARFLQASVPNEMLDLPFIQLLLAHLVYGGSLGWLFGRRRSG
jgi:ABC-type transport system involved in cytochrome c biogenesis permease subunit